MANKMTKREVINGLLNGTIEVGSEVAKNYLNHELELLDRKGANKKATKTQEANVEIKKVILETLGQIGSGTVSAIIKANDELSEFSNQKISALLRQLVDSEEVVKSTEKKVSTFALA